MKCNALSQYAVWTGHMVRDRTFYLRFYFRKSGNPASDGARPYIGETSALIWRVRLETDGSLSFIDSASVVQATTAVLENDRWYRAEVEFHVPTAGNGTLGFYLDGTQVYRSTSASTGNTAHSGTQLRLGSCRSATPGLTLILDDVALNDDQGASQNGLPGEGRIVLLRPSADDSVSGFTGGGLGTSNLYQGVNDVPPTGVAAGSATNQSQIRSGVANTTDNYAARVPSYDSGIGAGNPVTLVQAVANIGSDAVAPAAVDAALSVTANPADGNEASAATPAANIDTYPTAWLTRRGPVVYAPTVSGPTQPVVKIRRALSNTAVLHADLLGLYVEYRRIISGSATLAGSGVLAAVGSRRRFGRAVLVGAGSLAAVGSRIRRGSAALSGSGVLTAQGIRSRGAQAVLSGGGQLAAAAHRVRYGAGVLAGGSTLAAIGSAIRRGRAALSGSGTLTARADVAEPTIEIRHVRSERIEPIRLEGSE